MKPVDYHTIVAEIEDYAILLLDKNGIVMDWNKGAEKLKGYTSDEIIGKSFRLFYTDEDCADELPGKLMQEAALKGKATNEGWRVRKDGSRFWGNILITAVYTDKNELTGFLKISRDLTKKKVIEEKLTQINEELELQVEERTKKLAASEQKTLKANRLYHFISNINKSIVHITEQQELLDTACTIATEVGNFKMAWIGLIDEEGLLNRVSFSGDEAGASRIMQPVRLDQNNPLHKDIPTVRVLKTGVYSVNNDMQNDPALSHWKKEFIAQNIHAGISLPIFKSGKTTGIFGLFATVKDFFDTQEIVILEEAAGDISFALEGFEKTKKHRETEQLLFSNEKRFRALIEKSSDMKTLTSREGNFIYASPSVSKIFGYSLEEFLNKTAFTFFHPDDMPDLIKNRAAILENPGASFNFHYRLLHKLGHWIWCEGTLTNMLDEPTINALVSNFSDVTEKKIAEQQQEFDRNNLNALINNTNDLLWSIDTDLNLITFNRPFLEVVKLTSGKELAQGDNVLSVVSSPEQLERFKVRYNRALSGEAFTETEHIKNPVEFWSEISFYPIRNNDTIIGTACHSRDITERKKSEKEREQMIADIISRNKNFEQFTYIISHNLRAPIANILGISRVLKNDIPDEERKKVQQFLFKAVEQLDEIVRDLNKILQVKTEITENKETVCFSELVKDIRSGIENLIEKQEVKITTDFSAIDEATTLKSYIQSIFYNLVSNSVKYRSPGKIPVIEIRSSIENEKIIISFKDNGIGIDLKKHAEHVFGLYKRFHLSVEGKGLGLFMVKVQLEVLGGTINIKSEPGAGTEFIIELPV